VNYSDSSKRCANKRIEPMTSSAVCRWFQFDAVDALLVTAHPRRSVFMVRSQS
jgi:hypothetical protein